MIATYGFALLVLGGLGLALGVGLGLASLKLAVPVDPRVERIVAILPGANCAACAFAGCFAYARGIVDGAKTTLCSVGGQSVAEQIASIMGVEAGIVEKTVAYIHCGGAISGKRLKGEYEGIPTCAAAVLVNNGTVQCSYGCVGLDDCIRVCPFDAIDRRPGMPPLVNDAKCTACGLCVAACPRGLIALIPAANPFTIACSSHDRGKVVRQVCDVGCIACGICAKKAPAGFITVADNLARINHDVAGDLGEGHTACPTKCILRKN